jgi:hypothetical protein
MARCGSWRVAGVLLRSPATPLRSASIEQPDKENQDEHNRSKVSDGYNSNDTERKCAYAHTKNTAIHHFSPPGPKALTIQWNTVASAQLSRKMLKARRSQRDGAAGRRARNDP